MHSGDSGSWFAAFTGGFAAISYALYLVALPLGVAAAAAPLLADGDKVAARMAFKGAYDRLVERAKLEWLRELGDGLLVLSGAQAGPVGQALVQGDQARASAAASPGESRRARAAAGASRSRCGAAARTCWP